MFFSVKKSGTVLQSLGLGILIVVFLFSCEGKKEPIFLQVQDSEVSLQVDESGTQPDFELFGGQKLLAEIDSIGFAFKNQPDFSTGLEIIKVEKTQGEEIWEPLWGTEKKIDLKYEGLILELKEQAEPHRVLKIECRLFADGLGFRYFFPEESWPDSLVILEEKTTFHIPENPQTWSIPADFETYEKLYSQQALSELESANTPITMKRKDGWHLSFHEANLTDYPGMTLAKKEGKLQAALVPWANGDLARISTKGDFATPWRTIQVAPNGASLLKSSLIYALNEPAKEGFKWVKPMKYVGIWWGIHIGLNTWSNGDRHGATTENTKKYIDFAAENNLGGVLAEGWNTGWETWGQEVPYDYVTPYEDYDLEELSKYAKAKNIALIAHFETGGDIIGFEKQLDTAFAQCARFGIPVVKTGYAGGIKPEGEHHHGQFMVQHYRRVLETALKYKIMLDVHEPIKPTGLSRTFPHMMTREGVRGTEWNAWSEGNPPSHTTILPFTRGLAGPIDYTPGIFDLRLRNYSEQMQTWVPGTPENVRVHSTLSKQLALYVVLYSPLQMAADLVENYENEPAFEFIRQVPVSWDESRVLFAEIGEGVCIGRRSGEKWFVGFITNEEPREIVLSLADLGLDSEQEYEIEAYRDTVETDLGSNPEACTIFRDLVAGNAEIPLSAVGGGGQAIIIRPLK